MRLFAAVDLPAEVKKRIGGLIEQLKSTGVKVKWVEAQNIHLTLKFFGEVAEPQLAGLVESVEEKIGGKGSFGLKLEGMGAFPEGERPHVIWVGVGEGHEKLEKLAGLLGEEKFVSHATIGRIKERKGVDLREKVRSFESSEFGETQVDKVLIMKSTLTPTGPVYEIIKEVKL